jgi:hypothetical protein
MPTIDIDFEVFKQLTLRRETESVSHNDVIRSLMGLPIKPLDARQPQLEESEAWVSKGIRFPIGTELRARYKGQFHTGAVSKDGVVVAGKRASSPSDAARLVTRNNVNGWNFWECRFSGETRWTLLKSRRDSF